MPRKEQQKDSVHLLDMDLAAARALHYCAGMSKEQFVADDKTREATLHALLILGEATKRLAPQTRTSCPDVPWDDIAGMRDRLIHGYDAVDFDIVWDVIQNRPTPLRASLARLLPRR